MVHLISKTPPCKTETVPMRQLLILPSAQHYSAFHLCECEDSQYLILMELCSICLSVTDLFYLAKCPQRSSMSWHVSEFPFFLRLNNVPWYIYSTFYLSIHLSMDPWVVSAFGLVNNTAVNMGAQTFLRHPVFSSFEGYPEMELLLHI